MPFSAAASRYQSPRQLRQKPGQRHQVDVLHIGPGAKMRDQSAEYGGFELFARSFVHFRHFRRCSQRPGELYRGRTHFGQRIFDDRLQPRGQRLRRDVVCDQILPDFDQHMRQTQHGAVAIEAVILQFARIGLIVANDKSGALELVASSAAPAARRGPKECRFPRAAAGPSTPA